ncbi:NAD-dependent epimerase/dehydratase family protein [Rossellomorea marisflavi]|uniref:NAD-dependent epimerase/dehydratase family protein n=1 Tax=Rossellomorea marisflavi TaxID=189381 RepID=UPI00064E2A8D|nr:NAD-dependent epimerase/dehydratase family protein [Rossellomorea marisflavi]KMK91016.1 NAD-dependent epimerase [Rossellomorea marisflavi]
MKKILITGKNSYVGKHLAKWLENWPNSYSVNLISLRDDSWKNEDFSSYDVVYHVAGIAHVKDKKVDTNKYYQINSDLTFDIAKKAKDEGVNQFIFLSSMSVYGIETGLIGKNSPLNPISNYGKSKLQAEQRISSLENIFFKIVILRPPMIYGKNCKGNYTKLAKFATKTPIFPKINNNRSMIFIDNLSEFVKCLIDEGATGLFFPQNNEYVNTSRMVQLIVESNGKKVVLTKIFNPLLKIFKKNRTVMKIFGTLAYDKSLSTCNKKRHENFVDFEKSISLTED